jgi:hypothetical protein
MLAPSGFPFNPPPLRSERRLASPPPPLLHPPLPTSYPCRSPRLPAPTTHQGPLARPPRAGHRDVARPRPAAPSWPSRPRLPFPGPRTPSSHFASPHAPSEPLPPPPARPLAPLEQDTPTARAPGSACPRDAVASSTSLPESPHPIVSLPRPRRPLRSPSPPPPPARSPPSSGTRQWREHPAPPPPGRAEGANRRRPLPARFRSLLPAVTPHRRPSHPLLDPPLASSSGRRPGRANPAPTAPGTSEERDPRRRLPARFRSLSGGSAARRAAPHH